MDCYRCTACGYVYDPAEGDERGDVPPGTDFGELLDGWVCPGCERATKNDFQALEANPT